MEPYFSEEVSPRQLEVIAHIIESIGSDTDSMDYIKTQEYMSDLFPIDVAVFDPTEKCDFYTVSTVGLSSYRFGQNFARSELMMAIPKEWGDYKNRADFYWPIELLLDVAYAFVQNNIGAMVGQVLQPNGEEQQKSYSKYTDVVAGMVTFAENFPIDIYEVEIEDTFTRFFQIVPLSKPEVAKVEDIGPLNFIKFDLHDSDGPKMMVKLGEKPVEGIDRLIRDNENNLKTNRD